MKKESDELIPTELEFSEEEFSAIVKTAAADGLSVDEFLRATTREAVGR
jgi:hypothetical protein